MKKILLILSVLVVLIVAALGVGIYYVYLNKDELVRRGTEQGLSFVLEVDATVGAAKLDLGKGSLQFDGIVIPNPSGYKSSHAMKFAKVLVEVDKDTLFQGDVKVVNLIELIGSDFNLEQSGGSSNFQDLLASASRFSTGEEAPPAEDEPAGAKMRINKVIIDGTVVGVLLPLINQPLAVEIPKIEMNDIGNDKEPVSPAEAAQEIIATILAKITEFGNGIIPLDFLKDITSDLKNLPQETLNNLKDQLGNLGIDQIDSQLKEAVGGVGNQLNSATNSATDAAQEATNSAKEAVDGVGGAVKDLFGRKKSTE
ncbi:MAG: hypothetical protein ACFCU1_02995 [Sumerlaeia bacterium]